MREPPISTTRTPRRSSRGYRLNLSLPTLEVVIPVYRPDSSFAELLSRLDKQRLSVKGIHIMHTQGGELPDLTGYATPIRVHDLTPEEYDHGATRDQGIRYCSADFVLLMTQDALPANERLTEELAKAMEEERCGLAYARQIARPQDGVIEQFTRQFNYPRESRVQSAETREELGIKTYFCSDACALYRRELYEELGGFEQPCIFNEDMIYAHRLIVAGYTICYAAQASVIHSHHYSGIKQLRRNFDLGVSQAQHPEIFADVSSVSEGKRLVKKTAAYLAKRGRVLSLIYLIYYSGMKWLGYKLGRSFHHLPAAAVRRISMNRNYWNH